MGVLVDRRRSHGFKLKEGRLRLVVKNKFFTMRVVNQWNRLSREAVVAVLLEMFYIKDFEQHDLAEGGPAHCQSVGLNGPLKASSNPSCSMIICYITTFMFFSTYI